MFTARRATFVDAFAQERLQEWAADIGPVA
jgi:hypothetical protein